MDCKDVEHAAPRSVAPPKPRLWQLTSARLVFCAVVLATSLGVGLGVGLKQHRGDPRRAAYAYEPPPPPPVAAAPPASAPPAQTAGVPPPAAPLTSAAPPSTSQPPASYLPPPTSASPPPPPSPPSPPPPSPPSPPPPSPPPPSPPPPPPSPPPLMCTFSTPGSPYPEPTTPLAYTPTAPGRLGLTWAGNVAPCAECNGSAVLDLVRLTCECDRFHYGPACSLCRPGFSAAQCDGTACAPGYMNGQPYGQALSSAAVLDQCAACDVANGYCASSLASATGEFCARCSDCSTANGALVNATSGTCTCGARFRGARCDQCLPQYAGAGCTACAPGYLNGTRGACDACDTAGGYCGVGDPYTVFAASISDGTGIPASGSIAFSNIWLPGEVASTTPGPTLSLPNGPNSVTTVDRSFISQVHDPHLSYCAPCADCSPTFGLYNATNATCTCRPRPRPGSMYTLPVFSINTSNTFNGGPSCIVYNEGFLTGACFPAAARVRTRAGWARLDEVASGTPVLAAEPATGALRYSPIVAWWHHERDAPALFMRLRTAAGAELTLSPNHYLHVAHGGCATAMPAAAALSLPGDVRIGDGLWVMPGGINDDHVYRLKCSPVVSIERVVARGRIAPITAAGSVLVERVSASSLVAPPLVPVPLRLLKLHHAAQMAAHAAAGQLGLRLFDALHAPLYRAMRVPQATNAAVARALRHAAAAEAEQGAAATSLDGLDWAAAATGGKRGELLVCGGALSL